MAEYKAQTTKPSTLQKYKIIQIKQILQTHIFNTCHFNSFHFYILMDKPK